MEPVIKCDQGYESYDSMSACGSERKSSLSDAEFDPISDDENDDEEYSKPGVDDGVIQALSEKLKDGMSLVSRAPMKNIDSVRENRRESAQPWSVQTQNSVTPSGGRLIRASDKNDTYIRQHNYNNFNIFTSQNVITTNLQRINNSYNNLTGQQNIAGNNFTSTTNLAGNNIISKNLASFQQAANTNTSTTNLAGNNIISKNLASFHQAANTNLATSNNNTNIISKNLASFQQAASTNLATINNNTVNNNLGYNYEQTPSSASSDEVNEEIHSLSDFPELQEFARIFAEDEDSGLGCIRYLFPEILPELSASDVNEGLGHIDQNIDFGKISPVSFSSTIVPPSVDSYPSSPISSDLLAALASHEQGSVSGTVHNESVVPDILSMSHSSDTDDINTLLAEPSGFLDHLNILNAQAQTSTTLSTLNVPTTIVTKYTSVLSDSEYSSTYTSSSNSFLNIRDQRVSFSTSSTPSHPGSIEYSPLSSAESQSPYSNNSSSSNDLELYSPNIIPVTVNDDLGEDDSRASSRQDNVTAKERLYQKIMADATLKRAKDSAWFEACKSKQEKLVIMIQKLCKVSSDKCLEARLYANIQVYVDNASQDEVVQLFKSVSFLQHASIVNNPLLTAYIREVMLNHGLE